MSPSIRTLLPQRSEQAGISGRPRPAAKPAAKPAARPAGPAKENRLVRWWNETESELKKVVWPTRKEWTNLTLAVIAATVATGIFLGIVDFVFERLILFLTAR